MSVIYTFKFKTDKKFITRNTTISKKSIQRHKPWTLTSLSSSMYGVMSYLLSFYPSFGRSLKVLQIPKIKKWYDIKYDKQYEQHLTKLMCCIQIDDQSWCCIIHTQRKKIILTTTNTTTNMTFANIYKNKSDLYSENIYTCNQQCASPLQYHMNGIKTHKW